MAGAYEVEKTRISSNGMCLVIVYHYNCTFLNLISLAYHLALEERENFNKVELVVENPESTNHFLNLASPQALVDSDEELEKDLNFIVPNPTKK